MTAKEANPESEKNMWWGIYSIRRQTVAGVIRRRICHALDSGREWKVCNSNLPSVYSMWAHRRWKAHFRPQTD